MIFVKPFNVYRGKAAIDVRPLPATWKIEKATEQGKADKHTVTRLGGLLVELAPGIGPQKYDWSKKISFALNPVEMQAMFMQARTEKGCHFVHDPNMKTDKEGQVYKSFDCKKYGTGYSISIVEKTGKEKAQLSIIVNPEDLATLKVLADAVTPSLYGWDKI